MIKNYLRDKAFLYSQKYALSPNRNYYFFGGIGGDCTNFISQCVYAGCDEKNMNYKQNGWYYIDVNNRAPSWTSVNLFREFILLNKEKGPFGRLEEIQNLQVGDIIQLKKNGVFFHTLFISEIDIDKILVCAHSDNSLNRNLNTYIFDEAIGIHIQGVYE